MRQEKEEDYMWTMRHIHTIFAEYVIVGGADNDIVFVTTESLR